MKYSSFRESTVNSIPLNTLHDNEMYEILTPNHLLFGRNLHQKKPSWESN